MRERFNWNDLPLFLAIAEHGSLAGAARALGVNHSTVFRRLQALEDGLGVALFERVAGGYRLTEAGADALPQAEVASDAVNGLLRLSSGRDAALSGRVRLATAPDLAVELVPRALLRLATRHPGIRVDVVVSDSDQDLARREADLALRGTPAPPEGLVGRRLADVDWWFHGRGEAREMDDAAPLIGAGDALLRVGAYRVLHEHFAAERFVARAGSLELMAALARAGLGLALLPSSYRPEGLVRSARFDGAPPSALWLLFHPDLRSVARVRAVAEVLRETVAESG